MVEKVDNPSLIKPDFTGLWSVSWIGGKYNPKNDQSVLGSFLSFVAVSVVCMSWMWGFLSPLIILTLLYLQYYSTCLAILVIVTFPYVTKINARPEVCRFYIKYGCSYFEGGASMIYERPPNDQSLPLKQRKPSMVAYHPHGIFTTGFFYNSGVRLQSVSDQSLQQRQISCGSIYGQDKPAKDCDLESSKIPYIGLADAKLYVINCCVFVIDEKY